MSHRWVDIFIVAVTLGIIGVDVFLFNDRVQDNTLSDRIRYWSRIWRPLSILAVFAMGLLAGHWWW